LERKKTTGLWAGCFCVRRKAKAGSSLPHPSDEDLSLGTPIRLKNGYAQDDVRLLSHP
jgi:hypothetical protein